MPRERKRNKIERKLCQSKEVTKIMSESIEIVEITDGSIACDVLSELKDISDDPPLGLSLESTTTNAKRLLSDSDADPRSPKKIRIDDEDETEPEVVVSPDSSELSPIEQYNFPSQQSESVIDDETTIHEGETLDDSANDLCSSNILEQNICVEKSLESLPETDIASALEESDNKLQEILDDSDPMLEEISVKPQEIIDEVDDDADEQDEEEVEEYGQGWRKCFVLCRFC